MLEVDTSFAGLINYRAAVPATSGCGNRCCTRPIIFAIALPLELVLGLLMAQLFLERMPGRQIFVSLLVLPTVISPIVAGATWRLMFDNRYGPINQIIGWFAGEPATLLWTVNPNLVYPAIFICEIWQWTPFMFLILLAALSNVDRSLTEAAEIDGAGYLAHLPQDRAAGDLAGHGDRHPDPRPRSGAHLRRHLGADRRAARAP